MIYVIHFDKMVNSLFNFETLVGKGYRLHHTKHLGFMCESCVNHFFIFSGQR